MADMTKFWDIRDKLKKIKEWKDARRGKQSDRRLSDLFVKVHNVRQVTVNIPNLFAVAEIERLYGSMENLRLEDVEHLANVLVIMENQYDPEFAHLTAAQREHLVIKMKQSTPASMMEDYAVAVHEVFWALKKNSIHKQRAILEQAMALLDGEK